MAKDMAKKNAYDEAWKKENTVMCGIRIQRRSGIPDAMDKAIAEGKTTKNAYIIAALREKLIRDGYLTPETPESEETT